MKMPAARPGSMQRLILGYAPANIVPAAVAIVSISIFTRLLSPSAFGEYSLAFSVTMVLQAVLFYGPTTAVTRFYAKAADAGDAEAFLRTMYGLMLALGGVAVLAWGVAVLLDAAGVTRATSGMLLVVPLLLLRTLVATNQTINRAQGRMLRLNVIECLHAVIGVAVGVLLVAAGWRDGDAVMAGLVVGAAVCAAIDIRRLGCLGTRASLGGEIPGEVLRFIWPLILAWIVLCALQYADRFLVDTYAGAAQLGVYVVAFSLVDRPITLICMAVTAGTFQVAVDAYVRDGPQAGRIQAGRNGAVLIGLALPACVGLMLTSHAVADVMVGPALRDGVATLIPIMAVTALLRGVSAHYIDHAFHLSNRSLRLFAVYLPSAVANIALSAVLIPRYGLVAAAYGALACQAVAVAVGGLAARRALPLWLPGREICKIALGTLAIIVALHAAAPPATALGLIVSVVLGCTIYIGCAIALDLGGLRAMLRRQQGSPLADVA